MTLSATPKRCWDSTDSGCSTWIEKPAEMVVTVETTADVVGCPTCGVRAEAQDRLRVDIRDLPCFGARCGWSG